MFLHEAESSDDDSDDRIEPFEAPRSPSPPILIDDTSDGNESSDIDAARGPSPGIPEHRHDAARGPSPAVPIAARSPPPAVAERRDDEVPIPVRGPPPAVPERRQDAVPIAAHGPLAAVPIVPVAHDAYYEFDPGSPGVIIEEDNNGTEFIFIEFWLIKVGRIIIYSRTPLFLT